MKHLQAEEVQRLNQQQEARAIDAEQAIREQTEAIRQQTMLLQELIQRDKERAAQEARLAAEQAELEKKRLEEEQRAAKKQAQLKEQEIRATQEQVQREEEQALEEFEVFKKQTLFIQQQLVALKEQTLALKQQTLATEQQTRLIQELFVQEVRLSQRTQSILVVLGMALVVGQLVGSDPTFIFLRGLVIIGTALLITLLIYLFGRTRQGGEEEVASEPKEVEENSNTSDAPLRLPPSDESDFH